MALFAFMISEGRKDDSMVQPMVGIYIWLRSGVKPEPKRTEAKCIDELPDWIGGLRDCTDELPDWIEDLSDWVGDLRNCIDGLPDCIDHLLDSNDDLPDYIVHLRKLIDGVRKANRAENGPFGRFPGVAGGVNGSG
jgi:hypothetical protein